VMRRKAMKMNRYWSWAMGGMLLGVLSSGCGVSGLAEAPPAGPAEALDAGVTVLDPAQTEEMEAALNGMDSQLLDSARQDEALAQGPAGQKGDTIDIPSHLGRKFGCARYTLSYARLDPKGYKLTLLCRDGDGDGVHASVVLYFYQFQAGVDGAGHTGHSTAMVMKFSDRVHVESVTKCYEGEQCWIKVSKATQGGKDFLTLLRWDLNRATRPKDRVGCALSVVGAAVSMVGATIGCFSAVTVIGGVACAAGWAGIGVSVTNTARTCSGGGCSTSGSGASNALAPLFALFLALYLLRRRTLRRA